MKQAPTIARGLLLYLISLPLMLTYAAARMPGLEVWGYMGFIAAISLAIGGSLLIYRLSNETLTRRGFGAAIVLDGVALVVALLQLAQRSLGVFPFDPEFLMYLEPLAFHIFGLVTFMLGLAGVSGAAGRTIQLGRLYRFLGICLVGGFLLFFPGPREKLQLPLMVLVIQLGLIYPILVIRRAVVRSGSN